MKPELTTNIKWYLATDIKPGDEVRKVVAFVTTGYVATLSACQGHLNCSYTEDIGGENEFVAGDDVLYWAYLPNSLTAAANKYKKQHSEE